MSPSLLSIILNLGKILSTLKDLETTISDAVAKKNVAADLKADLADAVALVQSGLINVPGLTSDQIAGVLAEIQAL